MSELSDLDRALRVVEGIAEQPLVNHATPLLEAAVVLRAEVLRQREVRTQTVAAVKRLVTDIGLRAVLEREKPLAWTTTAPTVAGHYWWRESPDAAPALVPDVRITDPCEIETWDGPRIWCEFNQDWVPVSQTGHHGGWWCGPLFPPA